MNLFIDRKKTIEEGMESIIYTETPVVIGEPVSFFSKMDDFLGNKIIAIGVVIGACKDEDNAPITPTKTGQPNANAWRNLYRVKITKIEE